MLTTIAAVVSFLGLAGCFICLILITAQIVKDGSTLLPSIGFLLFAVMLAGGPVAYAGNTAPVVESPASMEQMDVQEAAPSAGEGDGEYSGDLGIYHVEIKSAFLAEDYEGNPAIAVTYAWTNNSEETLMPMEVMNEKASQDGTDLDRAILAGVEGYDAGSMMQEVGPGTTIDVHCAFALVSKTAVVEFEISELGSQPDEADNETVSRDFDPANLT